MKLYHDRRAPNPRRVRVFLAEKGVDVELAEVDIASGENLSEAHLARNPLGLLPVLELDDGRVLRESNAICRYIEELQPEPPLFGEGAWERALVEQWSRHAELELLRRVSDALQNSNELWKERLTQVPAYAPVARERAERALDWLERELGERRYIAGDRFSFADITALCAVDFARIIGLRLREDQVNLTRWRGDVSARPSAKA